METISCFKYGQTLDSFFHNASAVARDINQDFQCICGNSRWSKYAVCMKDGSLCVLTTDAECLKQKDAEAILKLQAGFGLDYAEGKHTALFYVQLATAIEEHVAEICSNFTINYVDTLDWRNTLFEEIRKCLEYAEAAAETRPVTGNIDISVARHAFKQAHKSVVITEVEKAANCLSVMCEACYARVTTAELSGPGYTRVDSEMFPDLIEKITTRQITYLLKEHLPIPMIMVKIQDPKIHINTSMSKGTLRRYRLDILCSNYTKRSQLSRVSQRVVAQPQKA